MPAAPLHEQVRALVDQFVHDITELVRAAAFEALEEALGGTPTPALIRASRSAPRRESARSMVEVIMTPAPAGRVTALTVARAANQDAVADQPASSSMPRTLPEFDELDGPVDLERLADTIASLLVERPGLRGEEIARLLSDDPADVKRALAALRAEGRVLASGKARGMRYSVALDGSFGPAREQPHVTATDSAEVAAAMGQ